MMRIETGNSGSLTSHPSFDFLIHEFGFTCDLERISYEYHYKYSKGAITIDVVSDGQGLWVILIDNRQDSDFDTTFNYTNHYPLARLEDAEEVRAQFDNSDPRYSQPEGPLSVEAYEALIRRHPEMLEGDLSAFDMPDVPDEIEIEVLHDDGTSHIETYTSVDEFVDTHRARKSRSWRFYRSARNFWMSMVVGVALLAMILYYFL